MDEEGASSSGEKRAKKTRAGGKQFRSTRKSFATNEAIISAQQNAAADKKVTMRRQSRFYSFSANQNDLLNPKTRAIVEWKDVKLVVTPPYGFTDWLMRRPKPGSKTLVEAATGRVGPGEMFAIMGPTGSGKTSLLRTLAGVAQGKVYGRIVVNGRDRETSWRHIIAYIEAGTGSLNPFLTVRESLEFVSKLCLPEKYPEEEKKERVEHCIRAMGLEKVADSFIGTPGAGTKCISGGERKRLCIALELVREPKVLFLDEPTSGLDAATAKSIISFLHQLTIVDSLTVIMTVHQPRMSVLSKFEEICLLASGSPVYTGSVDGAIEFFEELGKRPELNENPIEYFLDVVQSACRGDKDLPLEKLKATWLAEAKFYAKPVLIKEQSNTNSTEDGAQQKFEFYASRWTEIKTLMMRDYRTNSRSVNYLRLLLVLWIFMALVVGFLWFQMSKTDFSGVQDRVGLVATVPLDRIIVVVVAAVVGNRARTKRERMNSMYRVSSYYLASFLLSLPSSYILAIIYLTIVYYLTALRYTPFTAYLIYIGLNLLHNTIGFFIAYTIGSLSTDFVQGMVAGCMFIIITRLFSSGPVNLANVTWILRWLCYLSPVFYTSQGLAQNEFNGQIIAGRPGEFWTAQFALDLISTMWCAGGLMIYGAIMSIVAFLLYRNSTRPDYLIKTL